MVVELNNMPPNEGNVDHIQAIETSNAWTTWRDQLVNDMYNKWLGHRS